MKILHVIQAMSLGGGARALVTLAKQCMRAGRSTHSVASLLPAHPRSSLDPAREVGIEVIEAPSAEKLRRVAALHDIVHLHFWNSPEIYQFLLSALPPMRLLVTVHVGGEFAPQVITRELVDFADRIQNTGPFAHDRPVFAELDPEERLAKVRMTYCPADFSRLGDFAEGARTGGDVAYIGTVSFVKMHPDFVKLCGAVRTPGARFTVCGPGDAYPVLERQSRDMGIAERFEFLGEQEDIRPVLERAAVFGYPLCEDNYSSGELILQEAAYAGLPAVVFASGGSGRMVVDGFTGHVVRSSIEYREAVEHLLAHPGERERMGRNAREYARQMYAVDRAGIETSRLYDEMMLLPKRERCFAQPDAVASPGGADTSGARRFTQSLGRAAPQFAASMVAMEPGALLAADERIAASSPVLAMGGGGIVNYRNFYPQDPFLAFWSGLVALHGGCPGKAYAEFATAEHLGLDPARLHWRMAQAAALMGEADLAGAAPTMPAGLPDQRDSTLSEDLWPQKMEAYLALGDLDQARELALGGSRPRAFVPPMLDPLYRFGLECHRKGHLATARQVYEELGRVSELNPEVASWAHFKLGELLLDQGKVRQARGHFEAALKLKPDHAKARILLTPKNEPLRASIGEAEPSEGYIPLPMALLNESLWEYYFSRRRADCMRLVLDGFFDRSEAETLAKLTGRWTQPGAGVALLLPRPGAPDAVLRTELETLFSGARLSVESFSGEQRSSRT